MTSHELELIQEKIEEAKNTKIELQTKINEIQKYWKEEYDLEPDEVENFIKEKEKELQALEKKQNIYIEKLEEIIPV